MNSGACDVSIDSMESVRSVISIRSITFTASDGNVVVVTSGVYQIDRGSES